MQQKRTSAIRRLVTSWAFIIQHATMLKLIKNNNLDELSHLDQAYQKPHLCFQD